jgi:hypothetical protein
MQNRMNVCLDCERPIVNWREQRRGYGRLFREGLPPETIKTLVPRCSKCITELLRRVRQHGGAAPPWET